ncbi:class I mannose-6-phosphate isomerase [Tsuneonella mangrovi]|uniref:class I mannose-6-phosphate isomerase n=1 Tax=Tsuneonella mangrovi TaxID=1982042 RepID=UPI000BA23675|nr:class I mannose-6-phosphate isomerase [Tsuneonella mangrovi]
MVEKVWGRDSLPPPFAAPESKRIGEIWFEPPPELPDLLVKYLFTSEKLSVQVHPSDAQAAEGEHGKEECWLVLAADPGAQLAVGFREAVDSEAMRAAALDGSIEHLLAWHDVAPGDFIYLPAGTVHAIGGGLSLIEIQQNSDTTYRLYDYGRPRELHLDKAIAVADGGPHEPALRRKVPEHGCVSLVDGPHFRLDRLVGSPDGATAARYSQAALLAIPLDAPLTVAGTTIEPGECALASGISEIRFAEGGRALLTQPT